MLVATYGTLRQNQHNHWRLKNKSVKFLGTFNTDPKYTMHSLGEFPFITEKGNTSIVMEVYEVSEDIKKSLDRLEGYYGENNTNNLYDLSKVTTPFGEAFVYVINKRFYNNPIIKSGDWLQK